MRNTSRAARTKHLIFHEHLMYFRPKIIRLFSGNPPCLETDISDVSTVVLGALDVFSKFRPKKRVSR